MKENLIALYRINPAAIQIVSAYREKSRAGQACTGIGNTAR